MASDRSRDYTAAKAVLKADARRYVRGPEDQNPEGNGSGMDAFIYTFERLPCALDEIEDALESSLGGRGEVTGTGIGEAGSNIDVLIEDGAMSEEQALRLIRESLADLGLPVSTIIVIEGKKHGLA